MIADENVGRPPTIDEVVVAGHAGDTSTAFAGFISPDPRVRLRALGALDRCGVLDDTLLMNGLQDPSAEVRRRAAELAAKRPGFDLRAALDDVDSSVVEVAAWACGEHVDVGDDILERLMTLALSHDDALVREAAVAALGAIGDERGLPAILHGCTDKPAVRRRAVLALAPFDGPDVEAALEQALTDRDWQVRQAAEDLVDPHR
jgi:HEAT repeat protein